MTSNHILHFDRSLQSIKQGAARTVLSTPCLSISGGPCQRHVTFRGPPALVLPVGLVDLQVQWSGFFVLKDVDSCLELEVVQVFEIFCQLV